MSASNSNNRSNSDMDQSQWIIAVNENAVELSEDNKPTFCKLKHPKSEEASMFLFTHNDSKIYEVLKFDEPYRSWFVEQTVQRDGSLMLTTPVDPVFLVLPYLIQTQQVDKYQMLDQLLCDDEYPEVHRLNSCVKVKQLQHVADVKGDEDYRAYRYNKTKTLTWLQKKVERVADQLEVDKIRVSGSATASYVASNKDQSRDDYIRYAHGMVSDYLPMELSEELRTSMGIKEPVKEKRALSNTDDEPNAKRVKTSGDVKPLEDYSSKSDKKETSGKGAAKSKLDKVDKSGMKSISSFFMAKTK